MTEQAIDIAIVGGGMVGGALALALAQHGFSVVLVEVREPSLTWDERGYDLRVSAISRASQRLLDNLGVWSTILADRATSYHAMQVWDRAGLGEIHFDAADVGEPDLGHIIENRVTVRALWRAVQAAGVDIRVPAKIVSLNLSEEAAQLQLDDGALLDAALVVGADGARSQVRTLAGIGVRSASYEQQAVVATVQAELGNRATAWQRFLATGPLALLPLRRDLFSIVWSTAPDQAEQLCSMPEAEFNERLTQASEARLGRLTLIGERAAFPLMLQHAERYVLPGLALVGDAAHVIHPLAGQGVNLGFLDAAGLVDALLAGRERGRSPGTLRDLRVYERSRRGHNAATQLAMDGFKHLFSNDSCPLSLVRNLGLGVAGRIAPLRRLFERLALGDAVDLPALSRPATRR